MGTVSLIGALLLAAGAGVGFALDGARPQRVARGCAYLSAAVVVLASAALMYGILTDDFSLGYVAGHSSHELPLVYKVSAFWAGQEGSFLLWLLFHAAAGCWLVARRRMNSYGLVLFFTLQAVLTALVLAKSPFLPAETIMEDGVGLNPLLQDPWMAVHPPVIFLGYALLAVPFCYGLGALLGKESMSEWLAPAHNWTAAAWGFLGAGIFIGGYWAYKVLGWGGYWGWDPVENSSLVPWLLATVVLHLERVARMRQPVLPMLLLAIIFTYSFVFYGTFLTRSGVLGDFSVHAFEGSGLGLLIIVVNGLVLLTGLLLLLWRGQSMPQGHMYEGHGSREFLMLLGSLLLVFAAVIVFLGMSMPVLTQLMGQPAAVDNSFYIRTLLPLAIVMMLLAGLTPRFGWGHGAERLVAPVDVVAFLAGGALAWAAAGVHSVLPLLLAGASAYAAVAFLRPGQLRAACGSVVAHLGVGLGLLAIVLSGSGAQDSTITIQPDESADVLGHSVAYQGQQFAADGRSKDYVFTVDGKETRAPTKLRTSGEDAAREPGIAHGWLGDVYLAPTPPHNDYAELILKKHAVVMDGELAYRYEGVTKEPLGNGKTKVTADIAVTDGETVDHAEPYIEMAAMGGTSAPLDIMQGQKRVRLTGISGDESMARLEIMPSQAEESQQPLTVTVSMKPFIWLLWAACFLVVGSTVWLVRRD